MTYGFLSKVLQLAEKFKTNRFIFCWDSGMSYREIDYPHYKIGRRNKEKEWTPLEKEERDSLLFQTIATRKNALEVMGFRNNFIKPYYEADDLIAYWVRKLAKHYKKESIVAVSDDADMFQLLDDCIMYRPRVKKRFTSKILKRTYGVDPSQWARAKAIGGCSGDDVEGVEGVADPKSLTSKALKYLRGELTEGKVFDRIESNVSKKIIERNMSLVKIPYSKIPLPRMILRKDRLTRSGFLKVFDKHWFKSFLKKEQFARWKEAFLNGCSHTRKDYD